jgi:hypothetical protein
MNKILYQHPDSPNGAFHIAIESLRDTLGDQTATAKDITDGFVKVLELLECVPVERTIYAAAKAAFVSGCRAVCREFLDGKTGIDVRRGATKDIEIHGRKVLGHAWM